MGCYMRTLLSKKNKNIRTVSIFIMVVMSITMLVACGFKNSDNKQNSALIYEIDPTFREFYEHLGGSDVLGEPISPVFMVIENKGQFTQKGELIYMPHADTSDLFDLATLGNLIGIKEPTVSNPEKPGTLYLDGHVIYPDFVPLYEEIGPRFVGKPLTEVHYNPYKRRYEQYFEKLAFYRLEGTSSEQTKLLDYGKWFCYQDCSTNDENEAAIDKFFKIAPPFVGFVEQHGILFTGFALTDGYVSNKKYEQVFENLILTVDPENSGGVRLQQLSEKLNLLPSAISEPNNKQDYHFYSIENQKGYNIPIVLWDYIEKHGGVELIGEPISELIRIDDHKYRQCFKNLCLILDETQDVSRIVMPEPLGYSYRELFSFKEIAEKNDCINICDANNAEFGSLLIGLDKK